ncbi:hypothetical protein AKJ16_DCAP18570 [Drosera capensis]
MRTNSSENRMSRRIFRESMGISGIRNPCILPRRVGMIIERMQRASGITGDANKIDHATLYLEDIVSYGGGGDIEMLKGEFTPSTHGMTLKESSRNSEAFFAFMDGLSTWTRQCESLILNAQRQGFYLSTLKEVGYFASSLEKDKSCNLGGDSGDTCWKKCKHERYSSFPGFKSTFQLAYKMLKRYIPKGCEVKHPFAFCYTMIIRFESTLKEAGYLLCKLIGERQKLGSLGDSRYG